jgi:peptidoglycan/LPS O-acetylase OafA/YrhL
MSAPGSAAPIPVELRRPTGREPWADNLRIAIIVGMIVTHVATAYLIDIDWYYMERTAGDPAEMLGWALVGIGALFGMGLLFLVAGLFTPRSLTRKGPHRFAIDRLVRLGSPLLVYVFVIDLVTDFFGYRGMGGTDAPIPYLARWWRADADLGPAWFIAVLLAFSLVYAAWRSQRPAPVRDREPLSGRALLVTGVGIAVSTFAVRLVWPFQSGEVFGLTLWELPQMVAMFILGVLAAERGWFDEPLDDRLRRRCGLAAVAGTLMIPIVAVVIVIGDPEPLVGGLAPPALVMPTLEAVMAVGLSVWVMEWFRRHGNRAGTVGRKLGRASYAAYLIHPPVVVACSLALRDLPIPAELKFVIVVVVAVPAAFGLGHLLTRWTPLRRIL